MDIQKQAQRIFLFTITPNPGPSFSFKSGVSGESDLLLALNFTKSMPSGAKIKLDLARQNWMTSGTTRLITKFSYEIFIQEPINYCPRFFLFDTGRYIYDLFMIR